MLFSSLSCLLIPFPSHPSHFDFHNVEKWERVQIIDVPHSVLSIFLFSHSFLPAGLKHSLKHRVFKCSPIPHYMCSFLRAREQVLHSYKIKWLKLPFLNNHAHTPVYLFCYRSHVNGHVSEWPHRTGDCQPYHSNGQLRWLTDI